jgi:hypothetical protein
MIKSGFFRLFASVLLTVAGANPAYPQGSLFTSLSGIVVDASGGVIPGPDVRSRTTAPARNSPSSRRATAASPCRHCLAAATRSPSR